VSPGRYLITPETFQANGGYFFADDQHRDLWTVPRNNYLPRLGAAYQAHDKLVVRAGWGAVPHALHHERHRSAGLSRHTDVLVNDSQDLPRRGIFEDPVPGGLLEPVGSSLGLLTDVGEDLGENFNTVVPYDREVQRVSRYQAGFHSPLSPLAYALARTPRGERGAGGEGNFFPWRAQNRAVTPKRTTRGARMRLGRPSVLPIVSFCSST
jgi:hypothetical protein